MRKTRYKRRFYVISCIVLVAVIIGLFFALKGMSSLTAIEGKKQDNGTLSEATANGEDAKKEMPAKDVDLDIVCVGDIMAHGPQLVAQRSSSGKYDFTNNFKYIKKYINKADLALCNMEVTFPGSGYTGYPAFRTPDALAVAVGKSDFDVALTSNNHMMDSGVEGIKRSLKVLRKQGMETSGSRLDKDEKNYVIKDVKGVKVAVVAYTYEDPAKGDAVSINGNIVPKDSEELINSFDYETIDEDMKKVKGTVEAARKDGAQIVVVYYHWGEEYETSSNEKQKKIAQKTANMDVDVIFASHPHVLQETDILTSKSGKQIPIFYSMGNFLSNQRRETLGNSKTEQGVIAKVDIKYNEDKGVKKITADAIPTWLDKYTSGGKVVYEIVPLDKKYKDNDAIQTSGSVSRAKNALEDANETLGLGK